MRIAFRCSFPILLAATLTAPALTGCAVRARVYDPYDSQYRAWAPERGHYQEWESETHQKHEDYKKRNVDEQKEYWKWRQSHD